jgi:Tol biopolymer transport system component
VQRLGFDPDAGTVVGAADWVTTGTRRWSSPDPSPDGRAVAMYTLVQPEGDVYVVNGDGTGLRQVTGGDSTVDRVPRWSPDGQWIAFFSTRSGRLQLWKVRADGSELTQLTAAPHNVGVPAWSPDGSRLAGSAAIQDSGRLVIVDPTRPWAEQVPERRPAPPGFSPFNANAWSPDGTWLAGSVGFGDAGIVVYSLEADRYERLTDVGQWPVWLPDSRRLLYVSGGNAFFVVDRVTKRVQRVYSVTRDVIGPPRLTRDGRHAYFTRRVTEADLWLVTLH